MVSASRAPLLVRRGAMTLSTSTFLCVNAAEEPIYIGEADPVGDRLKNHVSNKEG